MSAVTINMPGDAIGAEVLGVSRLRIQGDRTLPAACMEALDECGVLVFRELSIDDATQIAFSKALDDVAKAEPAQPPNIFKVTLNPELNPAADFLRGTFHWHIDGAQDEVPTKATVLSARVISASGGETEFASTYTAYDDLSDSEKSEMVDFRVIHSFEKAQRMVTQIRHPRSSLAGTKSRIGSTPWCGATGRAAALSSSGRRRRRWSGWMTMLVQHFLPTSLREPPHPIGCINTSGRSATW
jgi:alpha-ketoglutarate-dependent taurine dioxygenase